MTQADESLSHYGVKGMHWGVRKEDAHEIGSLAGKTTGLSKDKTTTAFAKKVSEVGGLHKVSDKDLQNMLNRLNMEKQYKKMMSEDADRRKKGLVAAGKLILKIGQVALPLVMAGAAAKTGGPTVVKTVSVLQRALTN